MVTFYTETLKSHPNDLLAQTMVEAALPLSQPTGGRLQPAAPSPRLVIIPEYPKGGGWDEEGDLEKWPNEAADFLLQLQKAADFLDVKTLATQKAFSLASELAYKSDAWLTPEEVNNRLSPEDVHAEAVACRRDIDTVRHWLNSLREKPDETGTVRMTVYFYIEKGKKVTRTEPFVSLPITAYGRPDPDGGAVPPDIADRRVLWDALINTVSAARRVEPGTGDAILRLLNRYYDDPNNDDTNKKRKSDLPLLTNGLVSGAVAPLAEGKPGGLAAPSRYFIHQESRGGDQDVALPSSAAAAQVDAKSVGSTRKASSTALVEINAE